MSKVNHEEPTISIVNKIITRQCGVSIQMLGITFNVVSLDADTR